MSHILSSQQPQICSLSLLNNFDYSKMLYKWNKVEVLILYKGSLTQHNAIKIIIVECIHILFFHCLVALYIINI